MSAFDIPRFTLHKAAMDIPAQGCTATGKIRPNWPLIRRDYESSTTSQRDLADKYHVSRSTLLKRAMREKWSQRAKLIAKAALAVEANANATLLTHLEKELEPWIANGKKQIVQRGFNMGWKGLDRLESIYNTTLPTDTRTEAESARTLETLVRVSRTSLGMSDGNASPGALSLNILTNQAAVQVIPPSQ